MKEVTESSEKEEDLNEDDHLEETMTQKMLAQRYVMAIQIWCKWLPYSMKKVQEGTTSKT